MTFMDLTADIIKKNFDHFVGTVREIQVEGRNYKMLIHNIVRHDNIIRYKHTNGTYFMYTLHQSDEDLTPQPIAFIDLTEYNPGDIKINISNPQDGSGRKRRKRKSRKKRGGFKQGQLVKIKWGNIDGDVDWWSARIIADNGGPTIVVWWLGLFTPKGFPLHEEIRRPRPGDIKILQGKTKGGRRKSRKMKGKGNFFSIGNQEPQHRSLDELNHDDIHLGRAIVNILRVEDMLTRQDAIDETVNAHDYDVEQWNEYIQRANRRDQPLMRDILSLTPRSEEKQIQVSQKEQGGGKRRKSRKMKGGHHLYKRLGVSKYASQKQIRKAYNKLKKKKRLTNKIKHAYNILSKKKSRRKYNLRYKTIKL